MRTFWYAYHKKATSSTGSEVYTAIFKKSGRNLAGNTYMFLGLLSLYSTCSDLLNKPKLHNNLYFLHQWKSQWYVYLRHVLFSVYTTMIWWYWYRRISYFVSCVLIFFKLGSFENQTLNAFVWHFFAIVIPRASACWKLGHTNIRYSSGKQVFNLYRNNPIYLHFQLSLSNITNKSWRT